MLTTNRELRDGHSANKAIQSNAAGGESPPPTPPPGILAWAHTGCSTLHAHTGVRPTHRSTWHPFPFSTWHSYLALHMAFLPTAPPCMPAQVCTLPTAPHGIPEGCVVRIHGGVRCSLDIRNWDVVLVHQVHKAGDLQKERKHKAGDLQKERKTMLLELHQGVCQKIWRVS